MVLKSYTDTLRHWQIYGYLFKHDLKNIFCGWWLKKLFVAFYHLNKNRWVQSCQAIHVPTTPLQKKKKKKGNFTERRLIAVQLEPFLFPSLLSTLLSPFFCFPSLKRLLKDDHYVKILIFKVLFISSFVVCTARKCVVSGQVPKLNWLTWKEKK